MSPRTSRYAQFAVAAVFARIVLGVGFPLLARLTHREESVRDALAATVKYLEPIWQAFELLPFLLLGAVCASLAQQSLARAIGLFVAGLAGFSLIYYFGYMASEAYMQKRAWTAASLAAGFVPMKCIGVVVLAYVVRALAGRGNVPAKA